MSSSRSLAIVAFLLCISCGSSCLADGRSWQPPENGAIRDPGSAIIIARGIWLSMHPDMKELISSEADWEKNMAAELRGDVWEIGNKDRNGKIGDGIHIFLSKKDARIIDVYLTQ